MSAEHEFPTFDIEGHVFSKLLLGHNPFLGGSYMSEARSRLYRERFSQPEPVEEVILKAIEGGVRGLMLSFGNERTENIATALRRAKENTGIELPTIVIISPGFEEHLDAMREMNCKVALVHGQVTDAMFVKSEGTMKSEFAELLAQIREAGFVPGMSTHNAGETIPAARDFDVAVINTPVNKIMWRMCPCEEMVLRAIRETEKKVIAMKSLAMGRIAPREAMDYVCRLPELDGIVVGIGHPYEAEETFGAAREVLASVAAR